jgi:hypothetical protein
MRPFLQGEPIVLVENGQLIDRNMRRERLTLDDLAEKARMSEIASIDEIKRAVLEPTATSASSSNRQPVMAARSRQARGGSLPGSSALDAGLARPPASQQALPCAAASARRLGPPRSPGGYRSSAWQSTDRCVCAWNRSPLT